MTWIEICDSLIGLIFIETGAKINNEVYMVRYQHEGAINEQVYREQCIIQRLIAFIEKIMLMVNIYSGLI